MPRQSASISRSWTRLSIARPKKPSTSPRTNQRMAGFRRSGSDVELEGEDLAHRVEALLRAADLVDQAPLDLAQAGERVGRDGQRHAHAEVPLVGGIALLPHLEEPPFRKVRRAD